MNPRSCLQKLALTGAASLVLLAAGTGVAAAHVSVSAPDIAPGSYSMLTFKVPNERPDANTVSLKVSLPSDTPFASVSVEPTPGWRISAPEEKLPQPVTISGTDATAESAVTTVTWTATDGGLAPGQFGLFRISVGPVPEVDSLSLPAVQTYSNGEVVEWNEPETGGEEPEHPAPTLSLTGASTDAHGGHGATVATQNVAASNDGDDGRAFGIAGLVVGAAGLVVAAGALVVARRRAPTA